ncbi:hypothetical protein [Massilia niastensis]|uniref:hypothetical protein n=1 Tax=Massilia niastensis TaxID=544911 RepID=UPI0003632C68|nr:hypothetical protein [Massilia niastensis]
MKLYDRISGTPLNRLPDLIHPGRYVLEQAVSFNGHTQLASGDLLSDDGSERCVLDQETARFCGFDAALGDDTVFLSRVLDSIARTGGHGQALPSPLLPTALINEESHANDLERMLGDVLTAGHLHTISKRPRIDLRYDETVTDVSRARRLTNKTYTHLASRSECWQRQTLQGIQPKRVLARFSEDEYAIYENVVYARLLDKLEHYLTGRLRRLDRLCQRLERSLAFSSSTDLNHLLFQDICLLWGETYQPEATAQQLKTTKDTRKAIATQLKSLQGLRQSGLYRQIARERQIGQILHRTNILMHDQHYRHVSVLWDALRQTIQATYLSPAERLQSSQQREADYSAYVGLVLRHALRRYGLAHDDEVSWAGHVLSVRRDRLNWELRVDGERKLALVPWAYPDALSADIQVPAGCRLCWPGIELNDTLDHAVTGPALRLSPMDVYVVEHMGHLVDRVLTEALLDDYAVPIKPLPKIVAEEGKKVRGIVVQASTLQVLSPLAPDDALTMQSLFDQHTRPELAQAFKWQAQHVQALRECPVCGDTAALTPQENGSFSCHCRRAGCGTKRFWRRTNEGHWIYQQLLGDDLNFRVNGRRSMEFSMPRRT